jgi:hypothetical protein
MDFALTWWAIKALHFSSKRGVTSMQRFSRAGRPIQCYLN